VLDAGSFGRDDRILLDRLGLIAREGTVSPPRIVAP
jgi:hypothetical protein